MTNFKSYFFQFISVLFSFLNVKLLLNFLGDTDYSTWLVISSAAGLLYALDLGVGSSVRNQLARLVAKRSEKQAQAQLVFTYYKLLLSLAVGFYTLAVGAGMLVHVAGWHRGLGLDVAVVLPLLIFVDFVTRAHQPVFAGLQQPHSTNFALATVQIVIFLVMQVALIPNSDVIDGKLRAVTFLVFGASIATNALMLFRLNRLIPIFAIARKARSFAIKSRQALILVKRGVPFFLVQGEFAVLTQMALYFIYANFPGDLVVQVGIADKVFAPAIIVATIVMYPLWSGYTVLIHRGESAKVRRMLRRQEAVALVALPVLMMSIIFYDEIVKLWLGRTVESPIFAFFAVLKVYAIFLNSVYSYFMNGVGKLRPQIAVYSLGLLIALPTLYFTSLLHNIYVCLSITPAVLLVSALVQRHFVFNVELAEPPSTA